MAIQVNGTEVISNSRALNNIASVDATTVAAFGAAGVGGGSLSRTASGTINSGRSVSLNSDGTVSQTAGAYYLDETLPSTTTYYDAGFSNSNLGFWYHANEARMIDGDGTTFLHIFQTGTGNYIYCQAFTLNSTTRVITHGTPVAIYTGTDGTQFSVTYDSGEDAWLLGYGRGSDGYVRVATVSGTTVTLGSETSVGHGLGKRGIVNPIYDPTSGYVLGYYYKETAHVFKMFDINGSNRTVSVGSEISPFPTLLQGYVNLRFIHLPHLNRVGIVAAYGTSGRANSFSVTNLNSISLGTELSFSNTVTQPVQQSGINPIYVPVDSTGGVADGGVYYLMIENNGALYYTLLTFTATTVTKVFNDKEVPKLAIGPYATALTYANTGWFDPTAKAVRFNAREQDNGNGQYVFKYSIGSSGALTDSTEHYSWTPNNNEWGAGAAYPLRTDIGLLYAMTANYDDKYQIIQAESGSTSVTEFLGFSSGTYTNGQTAKIDIVGSVNAGQSGLTVGEQYFIAANGDLALAPIKDTGDFRQEAGKALSATEIFVKG